MFFDLVSPLLEIYSKEMLKYEQIFIHTYANCGVINSEKLETLQISNNEGICSFSDVF